MSADRPDACPRCGSTDPAEDYPAGRPDLWTDGLNPMLGCTDNYHDGKPGTMFHPDRPTDRCPTCSADDPADDNCGGVGPYCDDRWHDHPTDDLPARLERRAVCDCDECTDLRTAATRIRELEASIRTHREEVESGTCFGYDHTLWSVLDD